MLDKANSGNSVTMCLVGVDDELSKLPLSVATLAI